MSETPKHSGMQERDLFTIISTTESTYSDSAKRTVRANAAAWSRRQQKEARQAAGPNSTSNVKAGTKTLPATSHRQRFSRAQETSQQVRELAASVTESPVGSGFFPTDEITEEAGGYSLESDKSSGMIFSNMFMSGDEASAWSDASETSMFLVMPPPTPSPTAFLDGAGYFDPFATSVVPINRNMAFLLNLYCNTILPRINFDKSIADGYNHWTVTLALQHPMFLYAVLCRSSIERESEKEESTEKSRTSLTILRRPPKQESRPESIEFRLEAIRHLNQHLRHTKAGDDSLPILHTIAFLLRSETLYGDLDDIRAHLSGMHQLRALGASFDHYPSSNLAPVFYTLYLCCAMTRVRPPFAPPVLDELGVSASTGDMLKHCPAQELGLTASGFCTRFTVEALGLRMLELVAQRRKYFLFKALSSRNFVQPTSEEHEYFVLTELLVDYRLLSLPFESDTVITPLQECVRLALFTFGHLTKMSFEPGSLWTRALVNQFKESLEQTDLASFWSPLSTLLLWIVFLGAHVSQSLKEHPWFILHLANGVNLLKLQAADEMREVLVRFFYVETCFAQSMQTIWEEASLIANGLGSH